ncbi:MAG: tetratricopeptide repeat protein [Arenicella sp.]|nr:tetratricopeptide repeat protein [Arenicella sp.]
MAKLLLSIAKLGSLLALTLSLSACISTSSIDVPSQDPAEVEDRAVVNGQPLLLPEQNVFTAEPLSGDEPMSPVVNRLVAIAGDQRRVGNWESAASSLERALRIEPRNGRLWSRLAQVRYDQKAWQKAIQLAAKSNTLSGGNSNLLRQNWVLMANSHDALGDSVLAERYRVKLTEPYLN